MNLRAFSVFIYITSFLISTFPERIRLKKMEKTDPQKAYALSVKEVKRAFHAMLKIAGVKIDVDGLENIPEEACLYVGNHSSYFDILVTGEVIPDGTGYVAKDTLGKIPGLVSWMGLIHCLFLKRDDIRAGLKMILDGVDIIKEGYSMFIFPEGTRTKTGELGEFKGGSLKMAQKAGAPIVPVAISGTGDIFENNPGLRVKPSHVHISFGTPFKFSDLSREEKKIAGEYTKNCIVGLLEKQKISEQ